MTAHLLSHVQNFITITLLKLGWKQNENFNKFELWWKNRLWNGPQYFCWRGHHNEHDGVSNHQHHHCLLNHLLIQAQIKENIKAPCHWLLCGEFTNEFPTQMASNMQYISIWLRHHVISSATIWCHIFIQTEGNMKPWDNWLIQREWNCVHSILRMLWIHDMSIETI